MALVETWFVKNNSYANIFISDIMVPYTIVPEESKDLIGIGNTAESIANSIIIRNASLNIVAGGPNAGKRELDSDYLHSHDDFSLIVHTHTGLDILTGGPSTDADSLHTHDGLTSVSEVDILINDAITNINISDYVTKAGSINQLSDIFSEGAVIEDAVSKAHDASHSLLEHIDDGLVTTAKLTLLMDGSNADCCHTHSFQIHNNLTGLDGGAAGEYFHLTLSQHDTLTDGSNADALHTHSGTDGVGIHNDLDLLQGGNPINDEFYHLGLDDLTTLTTGVNADELHSHTIDRLDDTLINPSNLADLDVVQYTGEKWENINLSDQFASRQFLNGTFREFFDCIATSDGTTVTATLTNPDDPSHGDLIMQFSDGDFVLNTPVSIELTPGSDASPQKNYVYILKDTKVLTLSTTEWPTCEYIKVSFFLLPSAGHTQDEGPYITQNINNGLKREGCTGHMVHMGDRIRADGAYYFSGLDPNGEDQDTNSSYFNYIGASESYFKITSGIIKQMHDHTIPAFDSEIGHIHVINWFGDNYHHSHGISEIIADSLGNSLGNKYFNLFFFAVGNKTGTSSPIMCLLPSGSYVSQVSAENDVDGYDNLTMPREFSLDSSTGVPICRMTLRWSGGTTTLNHISTTDLRSDGITAGGGSAGASTNFADNQFTVFNVTDNTKIVDLDVSGVTTSTTRTMTIPDVDGTIITDANPGDLDHDSLLNFVANEHIDWTNASENLLTTGDISIDSNSKKLYFGENQESYIYYDSNDLRIGFSNPSIGLGTQKIRINDDLLVDGTIITGTTTLDSASLTDSTNQFAITTSENHFADGTGIWESDGSTSIGDFNDTWFDLTSATGNVALAVQGTVSKIHMVATAHDTGERQFIFVMSGGEMRFRKFSDAGGFTATFQSFDMTNGNCRIWNNLLVSGDLDITGTFTSTGGYAGTLSVDGDIQADDIDITGDVIVSGDRGESVTLNFGGGGTGEVATMTFLGGILIEHTLVP